MYSGPFIVSFLFELPRLNGTRCAADCGLKPSGVLLMALMSSFGVSDIVGSAIGAATGWYGVVAELYRRSNRGRRFFDTSRTAAWVLSADLDLLNWVCATSNSSDVAVHFELDWRQVGAAVRFRQGVQLVQMPNRNCPSGNERPQTGCKRMCRFAEDKNRSSRCRRQMHASWRSQLLPTKPFVCAIDLLLLLPCRKSTHQKKLNCFKAAGPRR
jgi:hypothetical protein